MYDSELSDDIGTRYINMGHRAGSGSAGTTGEGSRKGACIFVSQAGSARLARGAMGAWREMARRCSAWQTS